MTRSRLLPRAAFLLALAGLALLLQACGGTPPAAGASSDNPGAATPSDAQPAAAPTPAPPAAIGKVGAPVAGGGTSITVQNVRESSTLPDGQKVRDGDKFVIADVTIENTGGDSISYSQYSFSIADGTGARYDAVVTLDSKAIRQGDLAKGEKTTGYIAFQIKKDATGFVMSYQPAGAGALQVKLS